MTVKGLRNAIHGIDDNMPVVLRIRSEREPSMLPAFGYYVVRCNNAGYVLETVAVFDDEAAAKSLAASKNASRVTGDDYIRVDDFFLYSSSPIFEEPVSTDSLRRNLVAITVSCDTEDMMPILILDGDDGDENEA